MRSVLYNSFGETSSILQVAEEEKPSIKKPDGVLIKVKAVAVNPLDWKLFKGEMKFLSGSKFPRHIGLDFSGVVESVGTGVSDFSSGDEVFGSVENSFVEGVLSEYIVTSSKCVWKKPSRLSFSEASTLPIVGSAALHCIEIFSVAKPGVNILINGCTGGMGGFAVQIAKFAGASVTGVCSTRGISYAERWGCDRVIDYTKQDVKTITELRGQFDVVIDMTAKWSMTDCNPFMKEKAIMINVVPDVISIISNPFVNFFGFANHQVRVLMTEVKQASLKRLNELVEQGLQIEIAQTFTMDQVKGAYDFAQKGGVIGKVVITVGA